MPLPVVVLRRFREGCDDGLSLDAVVIRNVAADYFAALCSLSIR